MFNLKQESINGLLENALIENKKVFKLESREERAALLKSGFKDKDIESLYLNLNDITIISVNWSD